MAMTLQEFIQLATTRRATRHFRTDPVPEELLTQLLDVARWSPSGYNLQPAHFVVVDDPLIKRQLYDACMSQSQVLEAPVVVVFAGDRLAAEHNLDAMLAMEREADTITPASERQIRDCVSLAFHQGPYGLGWLWKAVLVPCIRLVRPMPDVPAVHKRAWLTKQVMLSSMVFMLAAHAAGLATVPMEGFDERRVKRLLNLPDSVVVPVIIPLGYAADGVRRKTRLPLAHGVHRNRW